MEPDTQQYHSTNTPIPKQKNLSRTFVGESAAAAWAKACLSESSYAMADFSGMKAFGLLEGPVIDVLAMQLTEKENQQRGFWEEMLLVRRKQRDRILATSNANLPIDKSNDVSSYMVEKIVKWTYDKVSQSSLLCIL